MESLEQRQLMTGDCGFDTCDDEFVVYNHSRLRYQLDVLENDSDDYIRMNPAANYSNGTSRDNLFNDSNQFLGSLLWTDTNPLVFFDPRTEGEGTYTYTPRYWHEGIGESGEMAVTVLATENPTANVDIYTVPKNESLRGNLFENDLDRAGNPFGQISHRVFGADIRELRTNDYAAEGTFGLVVTNFQRSIDFGGTTVPTEHGNLLITPTGDFSYTPNEDFVGVDTFSYIIGDERGEARANVNIKVEEAVSSTVTLNDDVVETYDRITTHVVPLNNDIGVVGKDLKLNVSPEGLTRVTDTDGFLVNLPTGEHNFVYTVEEASGAKSCAAITVNVRPQVKPIARDDSFSVTAGETLTVSEGLFRNDTDHGGAPLPTRFSPRFTTENFEYGSSDNTSDELSQSGRTSNGTIRFASNGSFKYTPDEGFIGTDQFKYHGERVV